MFVYTTARIGLEAKKFHSVFLKHFSFVFLQVQLWKFAMPSKPCARNWNKTDAVPPANASCLNWERNSSVKLTSLEKPTTIKKIPTKIWIRKQQLASLKKGLRFMTKLNDFSDVFVDSGRFFDNWKTLTIEQSKVDIWQIAKEIIYEQKQKPHEIELKANACTFLSKFSNTTEIKCEIQCWFCFQKIDGKNFNAKVPFKLFLRRNLCNCT